MLEKGVIDRIKDVETYSVLTKEKFEKIVKNLLLNNYPAIETNDFPSTEDINKLDDNRGYLIPTPVGKVWMSGKGAKELNNELIKVVVKNNNNG